VQVLLQAEPAGVDLVVCLAADVFGGAVGERHCAAAAPVSVKTGERASRLGMACGNRQHERGADAGRGESPTEQAGTKQFHREFSHQIDVLGKDTSRRIEDLVFPQYLRFKWRAVVSGARGRIKGRRPPRGIETFTSALSAQHLAMLSIVCNSRIGNEGVTKIHFRYQLVI
jgi:hypothetical protein